MSRPRSRSPHHRMSPRRHEDTGGHPRRFPWGDSDSDRGFADQGRMPLDGKRHPREDSEQKWAHYREETRPEGQRRPPLSPDPQRPGHFPHPSPEEFYRRTPPPRPHEPGYVERRGISPEQALHRHNGEGARDGARGRGRGRGGFREGSPRFEDRERPPHSPQRFPRERLPSTPLVHSSHQQRDPSVGWRRDDQGRGLKRSRDSSPRAMSDNLGRGEGRERDRGDAQGPYRERRREDLRHERSPYSDSHRREMDDALHPGYRKEDAFRERPADGFGGGPWERKGTQGGIPHREGQAAGTLIVEHDHGNIDSRGLPRWKQFDHVRNRGPDRDREIHPRQRGPSLDRFRKTNSKSDTREETRGWPVPDGRRDFGHEPRRSPVRQDGTSPVNLPDRGGRGGPLNHRGRSSPGPARGRRNPGQGGRMEMGPSRNHPRIQQFPQDPPQARPGFRPREEDWDTDLREEEPRWADKTPELPQWEGDRPGIMDRRPPRGGTEPGMPRHRESWNHQQNTSDMTVVTEETLTIKVDMKRPTNQNSQMCYSSERQLSLDLVNVGRQRLDFLPMLEHSGTYRENNMHTGTFAQEIIQLVHQVKEHYFRGYGITLNERFSAPQEGGLPEEEEVKEVVEEERPTLNRLFNMNMNSLPDPEPLFSRLGPMRPPSPDLLQDPGDLRHDLERRRQERMEGVKVTIPGGGLSQRPLGPGSEQNAEYGDDEVVPQEQGGLSDWAEEQEQGRRWGGGVGPRRGGPFRQNTGPQRRNNRPPNRPGNHMGPMRRQNNRNNVVGANW